MKVWSNSHADFNVRGLPILRDNYLWLIEASTTAAGAPRQVLALDPGAAPPLLEWLDENAAELAGVLLTHRHADHVGGLGELLQEWPQLPVYGPALEAIAGCNQPLQGGEKLALPGSELMIEVWALGGHTRGHLAYRLGDALFCGDLIFGAGCGRLYDGTAAELHAALGRIAALPASTRLYCAHEYTLLNLPFAQMLEPDNPLIAGRLASAEECYREGRPTVPLTVGEELASNPFLRTTQPGLLEKVSAHAGEPLVPGSLAAFAALRAWRNVF